MTYIIKVLKHIWFPMIVVAMAMFYGYLQQFRPQTIDMRPLKRYCVGERHLEKIKVTHAEIRVYCGKGENERIGILGRSYE